MIIFVPDSRLPTPDSRLPTPDSRLPTPDSRLPLTQHENPHLIKNCYTLLYVG
ncbi:MAG: hypothetical protein F6J98_17555 [Moorea sp. SIO4G2]|uniref:hypothetical protein n=1 Tax=unclassified Moorena TaxID=2683338 RepID=UPI0013C928D9|nr:MULTISPECIES: hypothetical protein [unclassified Moorena]NEO49635.1 hypothetical protein [Moorena sp. SIO4A3]NEO62143.1 hypothetical protein [Moorena sp. SIO4G2]NEO16662.1 hypothetical protein [Moorena sp. SIO3E8]NEO25117.1 hypothetical protein [Moorena sp. SIO4A5]NEP28461.1 hypothetical protein [Moorena sp. SIO3I6]